VQAAEEDEAALAPLAAAVWPTGVMVGATGGANDGAGARAWGPPGNLLLQVQRSCLGLGCC